MSQKYQRIKQADQSLWPPVRWVLAVFSSITLAVVLLCGVGLYCALGSVPLGPLVRAGWYGLWPGLGAASAWWLNRRKKGQGGGGAMARWVAGLSLGLVVAVLGWPVVAGPGLLGEGLARWGGMLVYQLPSMEMTELQFHAAWPMKLLLVLFVMNLVVATIRRIEFTWLNLGVLSVHSGIVLLAIGAAIYGQFKVEGDALLVDPKFGGRPVDHFYDGTTAALYLRRDDGRMVGLPLVGLPRYHDRPAGSMRLAIDGGSALAGLLGDDLRASVVGFIARGELTPQWRPVAGAEAAETGEANPAIDISLGVGGRGHTVRLVALSDRPTDRKIDLGELTIGYLVDVDKRWAADLSARFTGERGLVVEIPAAAYRAVHVATAGRTIALGSTGYTLHVDQFLDRYPFAVLSPGYRGATPSVAVVTVTRPDGTTFQRWAMYPFGQLTQDFMPGQPGEKPQRKPPAPDIRLAYIDASKTSFWFCQDTRNSAQGMQLLMRARGGAVAMKPVVEGQIHPIPVSNGQRFELGLMKFYRRVEQVEQPMAEPLRSRDAKKIGHYDGSLVCVEFRRGDWSQRLWLPFAGFLDQAGPATRPVAGLGGVQATFSRMRYALPYALTLKKFEYTALPASNVIADYRSTVRVDYPDGQTRTVAIHMNHPVQLSGDPALVQGSRAGLAERMRFGRLKFSQVSWDPQRQAYTVLGVGNNAGIGLVAFGAVLFALGIPWAFYIKPAVLRARSKRPMRPRRPTEAQGAGPGDGSKQREDPTQRFDAAESMHSPVVGAEQSHEQATSPFQSPGDRRP